MDISGVENFIVQFFSYPNGIKRTDISPLGVHWDVAINWNIYLKSSSTHTNLHVFGCYVRTKAVCKRDAACVNMVAPFTFRQQLNGFCLLQSSGEWEVWWPGPISLQAGHSMPVSSGCATSCCSVVFKAAAAAMSTEPVYFDKWSIAEIIKHHKHCDTHNYTYILVVD